MMGKILLRIVSVCMMFGHLRCFKGWSNPTAKHSFYCRHLSKCVEPRSVPGGLYISESFCEDNAGVDAEFYEIDVHKKHSKIEETVLKHIINHQKWRTHHEIKRHTREAFEDAKRFVDSFYGANDKNPKLVILDSGCGVGMSTYMLGRQFPDMPIIGIDRSEKRLSRRLRLDGEEFLKGGGVLTEEKEKSSIAENVKLVRADLVDFWSLVYTDASWNIHSNYLLYPNPYPKSQHFKRRWHGHPVFPTLLGLGGNLILRSNWNIYCEEFLDAVKIAASNPDSTMKDLLKDVIDDSESIELYQLNDEKEAITHFERKYVNVGVKLYQFSCNLGSRKSLI